MAKIASIWSEVTSSPEQHSVDLLVGDEVPDLGLLDHLVDGDVQ
jgi:hypothetical protein